jgi:two-component system chemotaxis response regulator CheB
LTLDVEMPRMDGVEFLRKLMPQYPLPIVMVSSLTQKGKQITMEALEAGAVDFVTKPTTNVAQGLNAMLMELRAKVKIASTANVSHWKGKRVEARSTITSGASRALAESTDKVVAIGASTGGTEAIKKVVTQFPATMPGVVIVQHMPPGFTKMFSERLNQLCAMEVKEAENGDRIRPGRILVAPGAMQMEVIRSGGIYQVRCAPGEKVSGHCPSVDVMMHSVAKQVGRNAVGVMLTGMGSDGADGMLATKVAYERGGAEKLFPIDRIAAQVISLLTEK